MVEARAMADTIAAKAPLAVKPAKRAFCLTEHMTVHDGYRYVQSQTRSRLPRLKTPRRLCPPLATSVRPLFVFVETMACW